MKYHKHLYINIFKMEDANYINNKKSKREYTIYYIFDI